MNNPSQREPEIQELKHEKCFLAVSKAETNEETRMPIKDPDTMLSMIVLLIACLGLAALAHVLV